MRSADSARPSKASLSRAMRCRSAFGTPRIRGPKATLSATFSHGMSAWRWKTTPRSAPGPRIGLPSSRISPSLGARKPAMAESSVVLPQPEAPITTTNSPSSMARSTCDSASTTTLRLRYRTVRSLTSRIRAPDPGHRLHVRRIGRPFRLVRPVILVRLGDHAHERDHEVLVPFSPAAVDHDGVEGGPPFPGDLARRDQHLAV